jgi:glucose/arabinose dehydrogenase
MLLKSGYAIAVLALCAGVRLGISQSSPQLPPPYQTPSAANPPRVIPQPDGVQLRIPAGFDVKPFADGFKRPRFMLLGPKGEILLTDSTETDGSVVVLTDRDGDGRAEGRSVLLQGLDRPYGMAFWKEYLYVAEPGSLKRYKYDASTNRATAPGEEVVSLKGLDGGHWTRTVLFDRRGEKLYLTVGSGSNASVGEDPRRAAINRYNPDGTGHEIYASGLRNAIGLRWYPGSDSLWAAVQERDMLGDDLVPDYFTTIRTNGFYGWPYAYIGAHEDPRNKGKAPAGLVASTIVPDVLLQSHAAVLDAIFYTGKSFPQQYHGGAFLAQHGSWNRSKRVGYNVVFLPFSNGKPSGQPQEFLSGFMLAPDRKEVWGRPVGLLELPDGSLLLSDDGGGKVWRISYHGK